jgi:hypothetical protein
MLFFELLSRLYRVMSLVATVKDRKTIFALYTTANSMASEATDVVGVSEYVYMYLLSFAILIHLFYCVLHSLFRYSAVLLFDILSQGHRHFIDEFHLHSEFIGDMMLEFYESVLAGSNIETLRSKSVLNPSNDGDNMTNPVNFPVSFCNTCLTLVLRNNILMFCNLD